MGRLWLPHTVDVYAPGVSGGNPTLTRAGVAGYFERVGTAGRVRWQAVSSNPLATLWMGLDAQAIVSDGTLVLWHEQGSWWTVRGLPEVYDTGDAPHIEVLAAANVSDGLLTATTPTVALRMTFASASSVTGLQVEVSSKPDFSSILTSAASATSQAGWFYVNGSTWSPIPAGGLPSLSTQKIAYLAAGLVAGQNYFVRWTPFAGATPLPVQMDITSA